MAKTCECPKPPGGSVTCSDEQLAICGYQDGRIVSGCFNPPQAIAQMQTRMRRKNAMRNWALEQITGESRSLAQPIKRDEMAILNRGVYVTTDGEKLSFVLPVKARQAAQAEGTERAKTTETARATGETKRSRKIEITERTKRA
jgi:hypothetical protein